MFGSMENSGRLEYGVETDWEDFQNWYHNGDEFKVEMTRYNEEEKAEDYAECLNFRKEKISEGVKSSLEMAMMDVTEGLLRRVSDLTDLEIRRDPEENLYKLKGRIPEEIKARYDPSNQVPFEITEEEQFKQEYGRFLFDQQERSPNDEIGLNPEELVEEDPVIEIVMDRKY